MGIKVEGLESGAIMVSGNVTALLRPTYVKAGQAFLLGFSDGTLVEGLFDTSSCEFLFRPLIEGAGIVTAEDDGFVLDWRIEWASIVPSAGAIIAEREAEFVSRSALGSDDLHIGSVAEWLRRRPALRAERIGIAMCGERPHGYARPEI